jgi:hypothetical protein
MSNCELPICITKFNEMSDNAAKSVESTWGQFACSITGNHAIATMPKAHLPLFNGWRYKSIADSTVNNGCHDNGLPIVQFSHTHVRRHKSNLVELSMLVLDFDGALPITAVHHVFGEREYVCYTSLNHQVGCIDKFRVVLPFSVRMSVGDFVRLQPAIAHWVRDLVKDHHPELLDNSTLSIGQIFILPSVRAEDVSHAQAWRTEGDLLDWTMFESILKAMPVTPTRHSMSTGPAPSGFKLKPDDWLETANGGVLVRDIDRKISRVRCPFHGDPTPSEFAGITTSGAPFLQCKKCGRVKMDMVAVDPIIAGLAKIAEKKRLSTKKEPQ